MCRTQEHQVHVTTLTALLPGKVPVVARDKLVPALAGSVMLLFLGACSSAWQVSLVRADLLTAARTLETPGGTITTKGALEVQLSVDADILVSARKLDAHPWVEAKTCDTGNPVTLRPVFYPLPSSRAEDHIYAVIVQYKGKGYDLSKKSEDICLAVGLGSMNPVNNKRSNEMRVKLDNALEAEIKGYEAANGEIWTRNDPSCAEWSCYPVYHAVK